MTLNENPENFFAQIDQAGFAPSNTVPGIGFSPDKMLLGRVFAYADAHRARLGANFHQLPVNQPLTPANLYTFDGPMAYQHSGAQPVYVPNSKGRPYADASGRVDDGWESDGEMVRAAYQLHAEDDDFGQAGTLVRDVWDEDMRARCVATVSGLVATCTTRVKERALWYWKQIDAVLGAQIEKAVHGVADPDSPPATVQHPLVEHRTQSAT